MKKQATILTNMRKYFALHRTMANLFTKEQAPVVTVKDATKYGWSVDGDHVIVGKRRLKLVEGPERGKEYAMAITNGQRYEAQLLDVKKEIV